MDTETDRAILPHMKHNTKAGRRPLPDGKARESVLRVRATKSEVRHLKAKATALNQTVSAFVRSKLGMIA